MAEYRPARRVQPLPRATQRIGCQHPGSVNVTMLSDPSDVYWCTSCPGEWSTWPASRT